MKTDSRVGGATTGRTTPLREASRLAEHFYLQSNLSTHESSTSAREDEGTVGKAGTDYDEDGEDGGNVRDSPDDPTEPLSMIARQHNGGKGRDSEDKVNGKIPKTYADFTAMHNANYHNNEDMGDGFVKEDVTIAKLKLNEDIR